MLLWLRRKLEALAAWWRHWGIPPMPHTAKSGDHLTPNEMSCVQHGHCPDCAASLFEGPHGGLSVNVMCSSSICGSRFNIMGPFGVDRISDAQPDKPHKPAPSTQAYR